MRENLSLPPSAPENYLHLMPASFCGKVRSDQKRITFVVSGLVFQNIPVMTIFESVFAAFCYELLSSHLYLTRSGYIADLSQMFRWSKFLSANSWNMFMQHTEAQIVNAESRFCPAIYLIARRPILVFFQNVNI